MDVYDKLGNKVLLGEQVGKGGEGTVFALPHQPGFVAKIYHSVHESNKFVKIDAMIKKQNPELSNVAAWPTQLLYNHSKKKKQPTGFLMPRINGYKDIHKLYSPKSRLSEFPKADWRFILITASNIAKAFGTIHRNQIVIGDVNHANLVVSDTGLVKLIDCDSFQIALENRTYYCEVGSPEYQPPEFQKLSSFRNVLRSPNHDYFGLGILVFQLLCMGRHPFSGRCLDTENMPLEKAIKEYRFAYGEEAEKRKMKPPPGALSLAYLGNDISNLFNRCFLSTRRPEPVEWVNALDLLIKNLRKCNNNPNHFFLNSATICPWCEIEKGTGIVLFGYTKITFQYTGSFDINALWRDINNVNSPGPAMLNIKKVEHLKPKSEAIVIGKARRKRFFLISLISIIVVLGVSFGLKSIWAFLISSALAYYAVDNYSSNLSKDNETILRKNINLLKGQKSGLIARWDKEATDKLFKEKYQEMEIVKNEYKDLPEYKRKKENELKEKSKELQLKAFLDQYRIEEAKISGIGPARKAALQSHGIETAADIDRRVLWVPGIGTEYNKRLKNWRRELERKFVFNSNSGVPKREIENLNREIASKRNDLENKLKNGAGQLKTIARQTLLKRESLEKEIFKCEYDLKQAEVDLHEIRRII